MENDKYWQKRFKQLEKTQHKKGMDAYQQIENQYREAERTLEGQISAWYQRFADNNEITLAEARSYLKGADLKEFKWDVNDYIRYGEENAVDGKWMKELENASAKYHISKLDALKIETQNSLEDMYAKQLDTVTTTMQNVYESEYYHTAYEVQKGLGVGWDFAGLNQSEIEKVISKPWAVDGVNFSDRIWDNKEKLISTLHNELTQNIMLGQDPQKAIDAVAKAMNTSKNNAGRLVMTEEAYFSSAAQGDCYRDLGVEEFEIVATLDSHTSEICQEMDGQHFPMKDYEAGVTAPPFHPWCRSTTVPYFEDDYGQAGERAARGEDGKTYNVPDDMTYKEWRNSIEKGTKSWTYNNESATINSSKSDKSTNSVYSAEVFRKQSDERKNFKFISDKTFNDLTISARKNGAIIYRGGEDVEKHLDSMNAASSNIGNILFFRENVCISEVLEETYHFQQNLIGLNDDKEEHLRSLLNEIDAKEYLLANASKYKIPRNEIDLTQRQLESYKKQLSEEKGG